jgi:hypothetical protein
MMLTVLLVACGDGAETSEPHSSDTAAVAQPDTSTAADTPAPMPTGADFAPAVYRAFAAAAIAPPSVTDSVIKSVSDPTKIQQEMEKVLARYDSAAHVQVAAEFGITVDSLNRIIEIGSREGW